MAVSLPARTETEIPQLRTPSEETLQEIEAPLTIEGEEINRLLAVVENKAITLQDYRQYFGDTDLTRENLDEIIDQKIIEIAMEKIIPSRLEEQISANIRQHVQRMKQQDGVENFRRFLDQQQLTEEEFIEHLMRQEKSMFLLRRVFPEAARAKPGITSITRGRLMIFESENTAQKVYNNLQDSPTLQTWKKMFENYSLKPSFLEEYGNLGWFNWGTRTREIEYQFFQLSQFEVSKPFKDDNHYMIAYKTGVRLSPPGQSPSPAIANAYEELTRRYFEENYQDKLPGRLRQQLTVIHPSSVIRELES